MTQGPRDSSGHSEVASPAGAVIPFTLTLDEPMPSTVKVGADFKMRAHVTSSRSAPVKLFLWAEDGNTTLVIREGDHNVDHATIDMPQDPPFLAGATVTCRITVANLGAEAQMFTIKGRASDEAESARTTASITVTP